MPQLGQGRNMVGGLSSRGPVDQPVYGGISPWFNETTGQGTGLGNQIQELGGSLGGSLGGLQGLLKSRGGGGALGLDPNRGYAGNDPIYGPIGPGGLGDQQQQTGPGRAEVLSRFGPGERFDAGGRSPELLRQQYAALSPDEQNKYKAMYMGASPGMQTSVLGAMGLGPGSRGLEGGTLGTSAPWPGGGGGGGTLGTVSSAVGPAQAAALGRGPDAWRGLKQAYGGGGSAGWQDFKQGQQQAGTFDALKSRTLGGGPAAGTAAAGGFGGAPMGSFGGGGGRAPAAGPAAGPAAAGGFGPPAAPRGGFGVGAPGSQPFGGSLGGLQGLAGGFGGRKRPGQATEEYAG